MSEQSSAQDIILSARLAARSRRTNTHRRATSSLVSTDWSKNPSPQDSAPEPQAKGKGKTKAGTKAKDRAKVESKTKPKKTEAKAQGKAKDDGSTNSRATKSQSKEKDRRPSRFRTFMSTWAIVLTVGGCGVGMYAHATYMNNARGRLESDAYQQAVADMTKKESLDTVVRMPKKELSDLIVSSPDSSFPARPKLTHIELVGWSSPRGIEKHGTATVDFCYTGDGVADPKYGSAHMTSENAHSPHPTWVIHATSATGDDCNDRKESRKN